MTSQNSSCRVLKGMSVAAIALGVGLTACGSHAVATTKAVDCTWAQSPSAALDVAVTSHYNQAPPSCITKTTVGTYVAMIHTKKGDITMTLDHRTAPTTVNNFVFLATHHFYDNILFHRVAPKFVIQAGDPTSAIPGADPASYGNGGPGYTIPDEFPKTTDVFKAGCLAMANKGPGTAGSQFFICSVDDTKQLAPYYSYFGQVTSGLDIINQIAVGDAITGIDVTKN